MRKYQTLKSFMISTPNIEKFITANIEKSKLWYLKIEKIENHENQKSKLWHLKIENQIMVCENQNYGIWKSKLWYHHQTSKIKK